MNNTLLDTYPFLSEIAKRLSSEQAAVMVGSGFSKNATPRDPSKPPFPDWSELGDILHARLLPSDSPRPKFLSIPEIASELQASIGRPALDDILTEAIPDNDFQPSHLHKQLLDLPWSDVFTTNYDTLLDRAVTQVPYRDVTVIRKPSELVYSNSPRLIKLHGCISDPSTCVVTDDDYRNYPKGRAPFVNAVCQSLVEKTLCIVGFSARDPNFITWINWTLESLGRKHTPRIYLVAVSGLTQAQQVPPHSAQHFLWSTCLSTARRMILHIRAWKHSLSISISPPSRAPSRVHRLPHPRPPHSAGPRPTLGSSSRSTTSTSESNCPISLALGSTALILSRMDSRTRRAPPQSVAIHPSLDRLHS